MNYLLHTIVLLGWVGTASAFLTTPSLLLTGDIDQTVWYTTLLMAVLLTGNFFRHEMLAFKLLEMSATEIWQLLTYMYVSPRQLIRLGRKLGIPLKYLKQLILLQKSTNEQSKTKKRHRDYHHHHLHLRKHHGRHLNRTVRIQIYYITPL